jgi:hypothetical protein
MDAPTYLRESFLLILEGEFCKVLGLTKGRCLVCCAILSIIISLSIFIVLNKRRKKKFPRTRECEFSPFYKEIHVLNKRQLGV